MTRQLIECVPNFSEGNDMSIINQITAAIESVEGVKLLNVDPGKATNRTVVTFVGQPADVVEGAFRGIQKAAELIDMSKHRGEHPRMGATDVCPFIPVANISLEETAEWAKKLGARVGKELAIPVYPMKRPKTINPGAIFRLSVRVNTKGLQRKWKILPGNRISDPEHLISNPAQL
jgi:glutamate formiminotransferase/formiminotetrahydrofolate cyclodeaminase